MFYELPSRDHEDGRATWQPQGVGSEAYLNGTSQEPTPEDARKDGHIRGRSRGFMKYSGLDVPFDAAITFHGEKSEKSEKGEKG
jgi:hypothetical protein